MNERETIMDKVRKLQAKAAGTDSKAEMDAFASKAAEMMAKHKIEEHELNVVQQDYVKTRVIIKYLNPWRKQLINSVCHACYCRAVLHGGEELTILGRPLEVEAVMDMYFFIERQVVFIARELYRERKQQVRAEKGLGLGVSQKVWESYKEAKNTASQSSTGRELILVNAEDEVKDFVGEMFPRLKKAKVRSTKWTQEAVVGFKNADRVQIRQEVG